MHVICLDLCCEEVYNNHHDCVRIETLYQTVYYINPDIFCILKYVGENPFASMNLCIYFIKEFTKELKLVKRKYIPCNGKRMRYDKNPTQHSLS